MSVPEGVVDLRDQPRSDVVSAFSVDVEDYFHVEAFRHVVDPGDWGSMEQRVEPNTRRLLGLLNEFDVKATFFVLGWVAERRPDLVKDILEAGHEVGILLDVVAGSQELANTVCATTSSSFWKKKRRFISSGCWMPPSPRGVIKLTNCLNRTKGG